MNFKLTSTIASAALLGGTMSVSAEELRLSHQWSSKDVRHQVAQMVADEVAAAGVDLEIKISRQSRSLSRASSISRSAVVNST